MGGGYSLGKALATLSMDTSEFNQGLDEAFNDIKRVTTQTKEMGKALDDLARQRSLEQLNQNMKAVADSARDARNAIIAISLTKLAQEGLGLAQSLAQTKAMFAAMTGSEQEATAQLASLKKLAEETGQPFMDLLQSSTSLLPVIRGTGVELSKVAGLAQRMAIADPIQGVAGASLAIREFIGGEYMSLTRRFEIPRAQLIALRDQTKGDVQAMINGLSAIFDKMGLTEAKQKEMAASGIYGFQQLTSEIQLTIAEGFTPLFQAILPVVKAVKDLVVAVREGMPDIMKFAGIAAGIIGAGQLGSRIPGVSGTGLGNALPGIAGGVVSGVGGMEVGVGISRLIRPELGTQDEARNELGERIKQLGVILADAIASIVSGLASAGRILKTGIDMIGNVLQAAGQHLKEFIGHMLYSLGEAIVSIGKWIGSIAPVLKDKGKEISGAGYNMMQNAGEVGLEAQNALKKLQKEWDQLLEDNSVEKIAADMKQTHDNVLTAILGLFAPALINKGGPTQPEAPQATLIQPEALTKASPEQVAAFREYEKTRESIQAETNDKLLAEENDYLNKRRDMIAEGEKKISDAIMAEKKRNQAQQVAMEHGFQLEWNALRKQQAEALIQHEETKKQIQDEANEAELQRQHEYNKAREDAEAKHRLTLLEAAAALDGRAIYQETQRYNLQIKQAEDSNREAADQAKAATQKRLDAEDKAFAESQAKQIKDLQDRQQLQREEAAYQAQLRAQAFEEELQAMRDSNAEKLDELANQHINEITQIKDQGKKRLDEEERTFIKQFNKLGEHNGVIIDLFDAGLKGIEGRLNDWVARQTAKFNEAMNAGLRTPTGTSTGVTMGGGNTTSGGGTFGGGNTSSGRATFGGSTSSGATFGSGNTSSGSSGLGGFFADITAGANNFLGGVFGGLSTLGRNIMGHAIGTPFTDGGLKMLHFGEGVMNPSTAELARQLIGQNYSQAQLGAAIASGAAARGGVGGLTWQGDLVINGDIGNYSPAQIKSWMREVWDERFDEVFPARR